MKRLSAVLLTVLFLCATSWAEEPRKGLAEQPPLKPAEQPKGVEQPAPKVANQPTADELKIERESYIYNAAGKRDPFLAIPTAVEIERQKAIKARPPRHPLEDFDISQFKLRAIVKEKGRNRALVGLPNGKHYTLTEGTTVGLYEGKVIKIAPDTVLVREMVKDIMGKSQPKNTILRLR